MTSSPGWDDTLPRATIVRPSMRNAPRSTPIGSTSTSSAFSRTMGICYLRGTGGLARVFFERMHRRGRPCHDLSFHNPTDRVHRWLHIVRIADGLQGAGDVFQAVAGDDRQHISVGPENS